MLCLHQDLIIAKNCLTKLPPSCGNLASLMKLNASNNKLVTLPSTMGECSMLEELMIRDNQLSSLPDGIRNCSKLVHLDLANNHFLKNPDDLVLSIDSLAYLDLQGNPCMQGKQNYRLPFWPRTVDTDARQAIRQCLLRSPSNQRQLHRLYAGPNSGAYESVDDVHFPMYPNLISIESWTVFNTRMSYCWVCDGHTFVSETTVSQYPCMISTGVIHIVVARAGLAISTVGPVSWRALFRSLGLHFSTSVIWYFIATFWKGFKVCRNDPHSQFVTFCCSVGLSGQLGHMIQLELKLNFMHQNFLQYGTTVVEGQV